MTSHADSAGINDGGTIQAPVDGYFGPLPGSEATVTLA
jgi:hypothetical protein